MPSPEKITAVAEITDHFSTSSAAVITEYRGLTVKQVSDLRRALGRDTTYTVVKNTLTRRAAASAGVTIPDGLLVGPTAIAFVRGDPVLAAKGLRDFARTNPLLVIKGGVMDGKALTAADISTIADLDSREVLLAKMAGALKALPTRAASLFQAPLSKMARLAKALEEKKPVAPTAPALDSAEVTATEVTEVTATEVTEVDSTVPEVTEVEASSVAASEPPAPVAAAEAALETPAEPAE